MDNTNYSITPYLSIDQDKVLEDLITGCIKGDLNKVKFLLTNKDLNCAHLINASDDDYCTPFTYAASNNHVELFSYLINSTELKIPANLSHDEYSILKTVCLSGNLSLLEELYKKESIANIDYDIVLNALIASISRDAQNITKFLLDNYFKNYLPELSKDLVTCGIHFNDITYINYVSEHFLDTVTDEDKIDFILQVGRHDRLEFIQEMVFNFDIEYTGAIKERINLEKENISPNIYATSFFSTLEHALEKNTLRHELKNSLIKVQDKNKHKL